MTWIKSLELTYFEFDSFWTLDFNLSILSCYNFLESKSTWAPYWVGFDHELQLGGPWNCFLNGKFGFDHRRLFALGISMNFKIDFDVFKLQTIFQDKTHINDGFAITGIRKPKCNFVLSGPEKNKIKSYYFNMSLLIGSKLFFFQ